MTERFNPDRLEPGNSGSPSDLHGRVTRREEGAEGLPDGESFIGIVLGGYRLEGVLGRGGMGTVYRATQLSLHRPVAVKILPREVSSEPQMVSRFKREIETLTALSHPNIVAILDGGYDEDQGLYYSVMELVDGVTLRQVIDSGGLKPSEALRMIPEFCEALEYAHSKGILHRDIKPANVLIDQDGRLKIADFGLSRLVGEREEEAARITKTQQVMGTIEYMAPEQREGAKHVDHRADIYSLGVVFYEMLTGELPIGRFDPPSQKVEVDVRLDEVVLRVLAKDPERRYQRASAVAVDVRELESDGEISGSPREDQDPTKGNTMDAGAFAVGSGGGEVRTSGWAVASLVLALMTLVPIVLGLATLLLFVARSN